MNLSISPILLYASAFFLCAFLYLYFRQKSEESSKHFRKEQQDAGLSEPASLHPLIDEALCIGCAACVQACPEQNVLGLIHAKAALIGPSHCIGHGACKTACPVGAIALVFGTEKRGVDIPMVGPNFETNVPGVFIAGELGGMGLIRNAIEQGKQAMEAVTLFLKDLPRSKEILDVVIIGAGPAGFSASLAATEKKLNFATLEQESLGGTVAHYPRGKIVMTRPADLPMFGKVQLKETTKESLLRFWQDIEKRSGVQIQYSQRVEKVARKDGFLEVATQNRVYRTRAVLLAIGRRGTPRKLGVPGEDKEKVLYRLLDPAQYTDKKVLVVGGGDSALEAALSICETPGAEVTLSYRGDAFGRVKPINRQRLDKAQGAGRLHAVLSSEVKEVRDRSIILETKGAPQELKNDYVIVCVGGTLPTPFLKEIGIEVETKYGKA